MIEKLVDYILQRDYNVDVGPGLLKIYKIVDGLVYVVYWSISRVELSTIRDENYFLWEADARMQEIEQAILKNRSEPGTMSVEVAGASYNDKH